jgi:hypothetical protein
MPNGQLKPPEEENQKEKEKEKEKKKDDQMKAI